MINKQFKIPILYVSHSIEEVSQIADEIILIKNGKKIISGSVSKILNSISFQRLIGKFESSSVLEGTLIKLSLQIVRRRRAHATTAESVRGGVFVRVSRRVGRAQLLRAGFKHSEYDDDDDDDDDDDGFYHQRRRRRRKRKVKKTTRLSRRQKRKSGEV